MEWEEIVLHLLACDCIDILRALFEQLGLTHVEVVAPVTYYIHTQVEGADLETLDRNVHSAVIVAASKGIAPVSTEPVGLVPHLLIKGDVDSVLIVEIGLCKVVTEIIFHLNGVTLKGVPNLDQHVCIGAK